MHPLDQLAIRARRIELIADVNPADHENVPVELDVAHNLRGEPAYFDFARFQRSCKGAGQSATCCCDDVIQRRRMRSKRLLGNTVVSGDCAVDAEEYRVAFSG